MNKICEGLRMTGLWVDESKFLKSWPPVTQMPVSEFAITKASNWINDALRGALKTTPQVHRDFVPFNLEYPGKVNWRKYESMRNSAPIRASPASAKTP